MAGAFYFIVPEGTTNMITNPSIEIDTTGYTLAVAGSLARSAAASRRQNYGLLVTPSANTADGVYYGTVSLVSGQTYTFSVDFLGQVGVSYRIYFASTVPAVLGTPTTFTGDGTWHRYAVTYTEVSTTTRRLYIVKNGSTSVGTFNIDGLQLENKAYDTTYCDGTLDGCYWAGVDHVSQSTRPSNIRTGGKRVDFQDSTYNAFLVSQQGTGMPPLKTSAIPYGSDTGSFYQRQVATERSFTLTYSVSGDGMPAFHAKRQAMIDLCKPDNSNLFLPITIGYSDGGVDIEINAVYEDGLGITDGKVDTEVVSLKFIAHDPMWYKRGDKSAILTPNASVSSANIFKRDPNGIWSALATGTNMLALAVSPDNKYLYAGGKFTSIGGSGADYCARYDLVAGTWSRLAGSDTSFNNWVYAFAFGPDGKVWIGGRFTDAGGIAAADGIVVYDPVADTLAAPAASGISGGSGIVYTIAIDSNYTVYAGGDFTDIGGSGADYLGKLVAGTWSAVGSTTAINNTVVPGGIAVGPNNYVYVSGAFSNVAGIAAADYMAMWNGTAWSAIVTPTNTPGGPVAVGRNGNVYFGMAGNTLYGITMGHIIVWNGNGWKPMRRGLGASASVSGIFVLPNGNIIVSGNTFSADGLGFVPPCPIVLWTGSTFTPFDIDISGGGYVVTGVPGPDGSLYVACDVATTGVATGITSVVNDSRNANGYPVFVITTTTTSRIYQIKNYTTGDNIYFNLIINAGEKITIDLRQGRKTVVSSWRGAIGDLVLPGSNIGTWRLAPGTNSIGLFAVSSNVVAGMYWKERAWSLDAGIL